MNLFDIREKASFIKKYREFANHHRDLGTTAKSAKELSGARENEYRSGRKLIIRDKVPSKIISYISNKLIKGKAANLFIKSKRRLLEYRAVCVYALRVLCGLSYSQICENMFNMTLSGCSNLCTKGYELVNSNKQYEKLLNQLAYETL